MSLPVILDPVSLQAALHGGSAESEMVVIVIIVWAHFGAQRYASVPRVLAHMLIAEKASVGLENVPIVRVDVWSRNIAVWACNTLLSVVDGLVFRP